MSGYDFKLDVDHECVYSGTESVIKPPTRKRVRYCKICKKRLSIYNLSNYCFVDQIKGQRLDDKAEEKRIRIEQNKLSSKRRKITAKRRKEGKCQR